MLTVFLMKAICADPETVQIFARNNQTLPGKPAIVRRRVLARTTRK